MARIFRTDVRRQSPAKDYDTTIASMAGNIAAGMVDHYTLEQKNSDMIKTEAVALAFAIVDEVRRVEDVRRAETERKSTAKFGKPAGESPAFLDQS